MKLLNKKNLQLNVQGLGYNLMPPQNGQSLTQSQMGKMQQTSQNHNGGYQQSLTASAPLLTSQQQSILQQKLCFKDKMTKVIEGIYVGNYQSAMDQNALAKENITHIINCSPSDCLNLFEQDITYLNINIQDNWKTNLFLVIYIILDFLRDALQQNGHVLIHCNQGISRSPSIVIAYLIYTEKINANIALEKLKKKYPYADPNLDFQIQLNEMYKEVVEEEEELQRSRMCNSQHSTDIQVTPSQNSVNTLFNSSRTLSPNFQNKSLLNKQVLNNSSHITISTPEQPSQKLNYDSYIQMQGKSIYRNKLATYCNNSPLYGSAHLSPTTPILNLSQAPLTHSANLSSSQTQAYRGKLDTIHENKEKQSITSSAHQSDFREEQSNVTSPSISQQHSPLQNCLMPDLSYFKNQTELTLQQKQQLLFKRIDSQNTIPEDSDVESPSNDGNSLENKYFLSQKISKPENSQIIETPIQNESQERKENNFKLNTPQENVNTNVQQISAQQALQMSSHSQQDHNCDENTEILAKSPSPIKKNNQNNTQGISIGFDEKDDELKNKLSDSDIDPLDSTDIQDFNTDTSASFSFDVSSSFNNTNKPFKAHPISAKSLASQHSSTQNSSLISSQFNGKYDPSLHLPCSEISS